ARPPARRHGPPRPGGRRALRRPRGGRPGGHLVVQPRLRGQRQRPDLPGGVVRQPRQLLRRRRRHRRGRRRLRPLRARGRPAALAVGAPGAGAADLRRGAGLHLPAVPRAAGAAPRPAGGAL
ncbi:MAG: hypothetical protein AVDCRST_MAG35-475, partial [uncultured Quadrisphaera sp.]